MVKLENENSELNFIPPLQNSKTKFLKICSRVALLKLHLKPNKTLNTYQEIKGQNYFK